MSADSDLKWLRKAEHWGEWLRFSDTDMAEPESIWLLKSTTSPEARFYGAGKGQIGPRHKSVYAATCWGYGNRYLPADLILGSSEEVGLALGCRAEVMAGGAPEGPIREVSA